MSLAVPSSCLQYHRINNYTPNQNCTGQIHYKNDNFSFRSLNIHGGRVDANLKTRDESETVYAATWSSSGIPVDKKGKRHELPIVIEVSWMHTFTNGLIDNVKTCSEETFVYC